MGLCYDIALIFSYNNKYPENTYLKSNGEIIGLKEEKQYKNKYIVKIKNTKLILYTSKEKEFFPGDIVLIEGDFEKGEVSRNFGGFNYRNYLRQKGIYGIINAKSVVKVKEITDFYSIVGNIKYSLSSKIDILYSEKYRSFLKGILIGDTYDLDENVKENFRKSSISHILAISGMHVTYVVMGIRLALEKLILDKKKKNCILICFLIFFMIITGFSVSCVRASIMSIIGILSFNLNRKNNFYISLIIVFFIIVFINPFNILNVGLWLSFLSSLGIILFNKFLSRIFQIKTKLKKLSIIHINIILSISAQILIIPIIVYIFNSVSLTFFIPNSFISIIIVPVLAFGYISIILSFIFFPVAKILSYIEKYLIFLIFKISEICAEIPFSEIYICTPKIIIIIMYYFIIFYIVKYFRKNKYKVERMLLSKRKINIFDKSKIKKIGIILCIIIIITNINKLDFRLKIYFIDVAQGDCTLVVTPFGKNIIIDGGEGNSDKYDYGKKVVFPYLLDRNINKIDYLVVSHRR